MKCERGGCNQTSDQYDLFDYCAVCSKNLCDEHMEKGCCDHAPALSGNEDDHREE